MPVSLTKESYHDVLIIGAGPAGIMLALALGKAGGVNVRIIDKRPDKVAAGQADGIQPRIMEVLQSYGLGDRFFQDACQVHLAAFYNPGPNGGIERTGRASDVTAPTARYPFECALNQGSIESLFLDSMRSMGIEVERPIIPTSISLSENEKDLKDPNSYPVRVVLKHLDVAEGQIETEIVHAKFVLGGDGAHSWVRKTFGIPMEGEQTDYIWGVLDMIPDTDFPDIRNRTVIHSNNGSCMVIPREDDKVRLYIQLSDKDVVNINGRIDKNRMGPDQLLEVGRKSFYPYTLNTPKEYDWWTLYIIGQRVASKYSINDRVFIAGDACHTHSPKAGQGMNASLNDTHNLGWKIALVLKGWADISLLKTYEFERRKFAQDLIHFDKEFSTLFSGKPQTKDNENGVTHEQFLKAFQTFGGLTSGIGVHYSPSIIVNNDYQSYAKNLVIGERMLPQIIIRVGDARPYEIQDLLPADGRFKVLIFAGDTTDKSQLKRVNKLAEEMGKADGFLNTVTPREVIFDIMAISSGKKLEVDYTDLPPLFRPHWSKVLTDDVDVTGTKGGKAYSYYGIDPAGAIVIVRPDQYVGMVAPFEKVDDLNAYFAAFLKSSRVES